MSAVLHSLPWSSLDDVVHSEDHLGRLSCRQQDLPLHDKRLRDTQRFHAADLACLHVCTDQGMHQI